MGCYEEVLALWNVRACPRFNYLVAMGFCSFICVDFGLRDYFFSRDATNTEYFKIRKRAHGNL